MAGGLRPRRDDAELLRRSARSAASTCRRWGARRVRRSRCGSVAALRELLTQAVPVPLRLGIVLEHARGGLLLGAAAARAAALRAQAERRHLAAHREASARGPRLRRAIDRVARQRKAARLQVLLQARLGILERLRVRQRGDARGEQPRDHRLRPRRARRRGRSRRTAPPAHRPGSTGGGSRRSSAPRSPAAATSPRPSAAAISASGSRLTRRARRRLRSPSVACGKAAYRCARDDAG